MWKRPSWGSEKKRHFATRAPLIGELPAFYANSLIGPPMGGFETPIRGPMAYTADFARFLMGDFGRFPMGKKSMKHIVSERAGPLRMGVAPTGPGKGSVLADPVIWLKIQ